MKHRLLFVVCSLAISTALFAQASGGQIRRPGQRKHSNASSNVASPPHKTPSNKTYTVKEMNDKGRFFYDKGNYQEAIKWYTKAAEMGSSEAQSELGFMYLNGEGVAINKTESVKWLRMAGENGDAMAQQALGMMYKNGDGVAKNITESDKWFSKAAPQYYETAKKLIKSDAPAALQFLDWVIDMGKAPYDVWSLFHRGAIYYYGECGQQNDFTQAFRYFRLAANKGNKPALYYVGLCFEYGRGIPKDISRAQQYYKESGYTSVPSRDF